MKNYKLVDLIACVFIITVLTAGCKKENSVGMPSTTNSSNNNNGGSTNNGLTLSSNSPVAAGSTLTLTASTISGASYYWAGPAGFYSSQQNPVIANFVAAYAGTYTCSATTAGSGYYSQGSTVSASIAVSLK